VAFSADVMPLHPELRRKIAEILCKPLTLKE
jgi:hypothetical protein